MQNKAAKLANEHSKPAHVFRERKSIIGLLISKLEDLSSFKASTDRIGLNGYLLGIVR